MSNLLPLSRKKIMLLAVIAGILLIYFLFPRYLMNFGGYNYKIMDGYAKDYYIDCKSHVLIRKLPPRMSEEDKKWLKDNLLDMHSKWVKEFDGEGVYLKLMKQRNWVDSFRYAFSQFDEDGELRSDVYESILEDNGFYYRFKYEYPFTGVTYGRLVFYFPEDRKVNYSYDFYVERSKRSCSNPQ